MRCPKCKMQLSQTNRHGVDIDFCPQCRGIWLDRGELDKLLHKAAKLYRGQAEPEEEAALALPNSRFPVYPASSDQRKHFFFEEFFDVE